MKKIFLIACSVLVLGACKKEETTTGTNNNNNNNNNQSKETLLTNGSQKDWQVTKLVIGGVDMTGTFLEACNLDDLYRYKKGGTYEVWEGASKCNSSDPDMVDDGTWAFATNETQIVVDGEAMTIAELTSTTLRVTGDFAGNPAEVTYKAK